MRKELTKFASTLIKAQQQKKIEVTLYGPQYYVYLINALLKGGWVSSYKVTKNPKTKSEYVEILVKLKYGKYGNPRINKIILGNQKGRRTIVRWLDVTYQCKKYNENKYYQHILGSGKTSTGTKFKGKPGWNNTWWLITTPFGILSQEEANNVISGGEVLLFVR